MNYIDFRESYSKDLLRQILKMKPTRFKDWLRTIEPELFNIDATYGKYGKLLTAKAFKFLMAENGYEDADEINKMIREYYEGIGISKRESL
jgi:hypothetical protein